VRSANHCRTSTTLSRPSARGDDGSCRSVRDPRFQFRHVNAERTFHTGTDEAARADSAITQHACDLRLRVVATRTVMRGRWCGDRVIRHEQPPAVNGKPDRDLWRGRLRASGSRQATLGVAMIPQTCGAWPQGSSDPRRQPVALKGIAELRAVLESSCHCTTLVVASLWPSSGRDRRLRRSAARRNARDTVEPARRRGTQRVQVAAALGDEPPDANIPRRC